MKRKKVKLGLSKKTLPEKIELGRKMADGLTGNANFASPVPKPVDIKTACDAAETAYQNAQGGGIQNTAIEREKETELEIILTAAASYIDSIAKGSETIILSAGVDASKTPENSGIPPQVVGLEAHFTTKKNEIKLRWKKARSAVLYFVLCKKPGSEVFEQVACVTAARYLATGLDSLKDYWFKVVAIGTGGKTGPDSDPTQSMAL